VEIPVAILLHQHSTQGHKRGISHHKEWVVHIGVTEDQTLEESFLEHLKREGMVRKPLPSRVLLCQEEKRLNNVGEVRDKLAIEIAKAHE